MRVRLTPHSSRVAVDTITNTVGGPALAARVRAVPENGKANAALLELVASWLNVQRSSVTLVSGQKSRIKIVEVTGLSDLLASRVVTRISGITPEDLKGRPS